MAKCRDNRKRRLKRHRRERERLERKYEKEANNSWLCVCGNWITNGLHCGLCGFEPPWGCPCDWCQGDRYLDEDELDEGDFYDHYEEAYAD